MKKNLLLLFLLLCTSVFDTFGQASQPYYPVYNFGNSWQRGAFYTSLIIPLKDTVRNSGDTTRGGDIVMQPGTFDVYGYNGTYWERVGCCVSSVSNSNGSVTVAPTTGDVNVTLNTNNTNTWTANQIFGTTATFGVPTSAAGQLIIHNATNSNTVTLKAGATSLNYDFTLPVDAGTANYVMVTNGNGITSWAQVSATSAITGILPPANGGTGVANNAASTITISGAYPVTFTLSQSTSITLPTTGTLYGTAVASITSAELAVSLTNETGFSSGAFAVFSISPALTGTPTATTASPGTNTTQIATTAFVATSFAPLASPALTGTPTAPTASAGTSTTQIATTAFVATYFTPLSTVNTQTGTTYTLQASDRGKVVSFTNNSAITLTIPSGLGDAFYCTIQQQGSGQVTASASGTTLRVYNSYTKTAGQYAMFSIVFTGTTDVFDLQGQMN
jgi:hypothetical protein